jgi:hypothetical protein
LGKRRIIGVQDCGASLLSFSFVAPSSDKLYFALGAVRSDGSSTADGDGVLEVRDVLLRASATSRSTGCSLVSRPEPMRPWLWLAGPLMCLAFRKARKNPCSSSETASLARPSSRGRSHV